jgi:hypothetical protein
MIFVSFLKFDQYSFSFGITKRSSQFILWKDLLLLNMEQLEIEAYMQIKPT